MNSRVPMPPVSKYSTADARSGPAVSMATAWAIRMVPATTRISNSPMPGAPWANVEKRRRMRRVYPRPDACRNPPKGSCRASLGRIAAPAVVAFAMASELDDPAPEADHRRVRPVLRAELGQNVPYLPLDRLFAERKLSGDFLVGIALRDQAQDADLRGRERIVGRVLGNFHRHVGREHLPAAVN